jgi:hypothetical protein
LNANIVSYTQIGTQWNNSAYVKCNAFKDFFTGAVEFTMKGMKVFAIADSTTLPANVEKCANGRVLHERARDAGGHLRADESRWLQRATARRRRQQALVATVREVGLRVEESRDRQDNSVWATRMAKEEIIVLKEVEAAVASDEVDLR